MTQKETKSAIAAIRAEVRADMLAINWPRQTFAAELERSVNKACLRLGIGDIETYVLCADGSIVILGSEGEVRPAEPKSNRRGPISKSIRFQVFARDGFKCVYCGRGSADGMKLHADHVHPNSKGGKATLDNLVSACAECNNGKSNRLLQERSPRRYYMAAKPLQYDFADRAWQVVVGCDNTIPCWKKCWAKRTVARLAGAVSEKTRDAHAGLVRIAGPADKQVLAWTGVVRINEAHLDDPKKWRQPAVIATGFHGDWGLLDSAEKWRIFGVMAACSQHTFFPLTKHHVEETALWLRSVRVMEHVNIGVSVMEQKDADAMLPHIRVIAAMGWKVHCWHEPAIGPIRWDGWEFLSWLVMGGESGGDAGFDLQWARDAIAWGRASGVPVKIKQLGSRPYAMVQLEGYAAPYRVELKMSDRRGSNWDEWPADLRVRQMPEGLTHV